jgi:multidrug efflux pump
LVSLTLTPMMCARLLRHQPEEARAVLTRPGAFSTASSPLRRMLLGAGAPGLTLLVAVATLVLTVLLYVVPKGFFPVQDTGVIQGISEATQSISFAAMGERSSNWPRWCWKTRRWTACRPSSAWMAPTPRSTAAAC